MTLRGLRAILLGILGLGTAVTAAALLISAAAGLPGMRAISGAYVLVGTLVFAAGAFSGLRYPSKRVVERDPLDPDRGRSPADSITVSGLLVGTGILFVLLGVLLDPDTSV